MNELRIYDRAGDECGAEQTFIYWDRVRSFMAFTGMSFTTLSRKSRTPESTLRKLLQGVTRDPRISTILPIFKALELDANVALGLSPARDYNEEAARENVPLTESLKLQLADVRAERDAQLAELDRLRKLVLDKGEKLSRLEGRTADVEQLTAQCADQQQRLEFKAQKIQDQVEIIAGLREKVDARDRTIRNLESIMTRQQKELWYMRVATLILVTVIILATGYFVWELGNLDQGLTAWLSSNSQK